MQSKLAVVFQSLVLVILLYSLVKEELHHSLLNR